MITAAVAEEDTAVGTKLFPDLMDYVHCDKLPQDSRMILSA